jgi:hypothetical protein
VLWKSGLSFKLFRLVQAADLRGTGVFRRRLCSSFGWR